MVSVNISYDINCYINGNEKAIKNLQVKLEVKNQEKKIQYANEFVQLIKSILTSTYKSSSLQIHRGIVLLSNVIHYDNFVLLDLIKSELEGVIFDLRSYSRNYDYDTSTRTKIRADATLLWDLLNPPPTPDKLSTTSNSTRKCPKCKQTDLVVLPCSGKCCTYCLTAYVLDKIKNDLSVIRCPCTKSKPSSHNLEIPTIISLLDMESADKFLKRQTRHGRKFALVKCTKCEGPASTEEETMLLGNCGKCNICFCSSCRGPYHGFTDCPPPPEKNNHTEIAKTKVDSGATAFTYKSQDCEPQKKTECKGAEALDYELEFYKGQENFEKKKADIDKAFETEFQHSEEFIFPWDERQNSGYVPNYTGEYSCLKEGKWLDDVIIEKTIRSIIDKKANKSTIALFESYVYSYFVNHPVEEFYGLILDKELDSKRFILALMNTEAESVGGHWIIGIADRTERSITIMDTSMILSTRFYRKFFYFLLNSIYLSQKGQDFQPSDWRLIVNLDTIQQQNSYDCGALVVANVYALMNNQDVSYPPRSTCLRKWIYDMVKNFNEDKPQLNNGSSHQIKHHHHQPFEDIPLFNPTGLKYIYSS